jgi:hypothetical protein
VCGIDEDIQIIGQGVAEISTVVNQNNALIQDVLGEVIANGVKIDACCDKTIDIPPIEITCQCDCTPGEPPIGCPDCPEPPGATDPCEAAENMLVEGTEYMFSQIGITRKGWREFFLASSSMNIGNAEYSDTYHGLETGSFPTDPEDFTRGAFMLMHIRGDTVAQKASNWIFD